MANPIPYTEFTANQNLYLSFSGLHPNAKRRIFLFQSTLDIAIQLTDVGISVSTVAASSIRQQGILTSPWTVEAIPNTTTLDSLVYPGLGAPGDTIELLFAVGVTSAGSGELAFYVNEVL